ncbi:MAG: hypothetical protein RJA70_3763 [Pseudomonadota bacterium]|jgi:HlyD family secretion protein
MVEQALVIPESVRRRASRARWIVALVLGAAALGGAFLFLGPTSAPPNPYRAAELERRAIIKLVEATGQLEVVRRLEIPAPTSGQLTEILIKTGDSVTTGQALAKLDPRAAAIAVDTAGAGLAAAASRVAEAQAALGAAEESRKRIDALLSRQLASESDLAAARATEAKAGAMLRGARAEVAVAGQGVKSAKLGASLTTIIAPMDGVVLRAAETPGMVVTPEQGALFVIGTPIAALRLDADVAESDIGELRIGQAARFSVPAFAKEFDAVVEQVGIDARKVGVSVRYPVTLRVNNADKALLPGMTATVRIEVARADSVLAVREAALRFLPVDAPEAEPRSRVWKLTPTGVEPVQVTPGLSDGAFTELVAPLSALAAGTPVAVGVAAGGKQQSGSAGIRLGNR